MAKITAKLTAKGKHSGKTVIIECVETRDADKIRVSVLKNGKPDEDAEIILHQKILSLSNQESGGLPDFNLNSLCAYWIALHETYFEEVSGIKITGEFNSLGLPYGKENINGIIF